MFNAKSLLDALISAGSQAGAQVGQQGGLSGIGGLAGQILTQATQGLGDAARQAGVQQGASDALGRLTGGKTSDQLIGQAKSVFNANPALATAVVVGGASTVLAAVLPARRACRVAPIEAIVDVPHGPDDSTLQRLTNALVTAATVGAALFGLLLLMDTAPIDAIVIAIVLTIVAAALAALPTALSSAVAAGIRLVPIQPPTLRTIGARDAVRNRRMRVRETGEPVGEVTFSAGITALNPEDTQETLFARADALLYRAKKEGRDRACNDA